MSNPRPRTTARLRDRGRRMLGRSKPARRANHAAELPPEHSMDPRAADSGDVPVEQSVVDSGLYRHGHRIDSPATVADAYRRLRKEPPDTMAWIGLLQPAESQLLAAAEVFGLHELALEDAIVAHQRPKLERYGETRFVVLRSARYLDDAEEVDFGEIHLFVGTDFVLTVRHSQAPDLHTVRTRLEADPDLLALGPDAVLYAVLDSVADGYAPVVAGLQNDLDEIETEVFGGDPQVSRRIYKLSREVIEFQRATRPLLAILEQLTDADDAYGLDEELRRYLRDVADHVFIVVERVDGFRQMLADMLTVNATLVSQAQNEEMRRLNEAGFTQNEEIKKISAWAAILFAPTLIGTVYGMNFTFMPEVDWRWGYPFAIGLMALTCICLYLLFKHRDWL